jgi:hypothetical protein
MKVVPDAVPGFEHHTFICSDCHTTELRVVFTRHGQESDAEHAPMRGLPPLSPSAAQGEQMPAPGLFGRVLARLRGH